MSDAALAWTYEFYRTACGLRTDGDDAAFLAGSGRVPLSAGAVPLKDGEPLGRALLALRGLQLLRIILTPFASRPLWKRITGQVWDLAQLLA